MSFEIGVGNLDDGQEYTGSRNKLREALTTDKKQEPPMESNLSIPNLNQRNSQIGVFGTMQNLMDNNKKVDDPRKSLENQPEFGRYTPQRSNSNNFVELHPETGQSMKDASAKSSGTVGKSSR